MALTPFAATIAWPSDRIAGVRVAVGSPTLGPTRWLPQTVGAGSVELSGLAPASAYRVWISGTDASGAPVETTVDLTTPPAANVGAASSAAGMVHLGGHPWFPFMVYGACSSVYPGLLEDRITLFAENPCGGLPAQLEALSGKALAAGSASSPEETSGAGVVGSFYPDEADEHGYNGALLPQLRQPGLGFLTLTNHFFSGAASLPNGRRVYRSLVARADVIGFDLYPLQGWCRRDRLVDVYAAQRELTALAAGKPTFQWIEAAGMNCPETPATAVTPATVRAEAWLAIIGGARGLGFFPAAWTGDVGGAIRSVASDVAALLPMFSGEPQQVTLTGASASGLRAAAWSRDGALYVAAVNAGEQTVNATLRTAEGSSRPLTVLGEGRQVPLHDGELTDSFAPLAVHLYIAAPQ
jgi:hypothetical protein